MIVNMSTCKIIRNQNTNRIQTVLAPNGKESILYQSILENLPPTIKLDSYINELLQTDKIKDNTASEIALGLWSKTYTKSFNNWFGKGEVDTNGEPKINQQLEIKNKKGEVKSLTSQGNLQVASSNSYYDLDSNELSKINPSLEIRINNFLKNLGVKVEQVNQITNRNGKPINAYGKANLTDMVIQLTQGRSAKTLPEEAAHIVTGILGKNHPIVKQMMNDVVDYPEYQDVKRKYVNVYDNESDFRFEAVGKVIADRIIKNTKEPSIEITGWWNRVVRVLRRLLSGADTAEPKRLLDNFDTIARTITQENSRKQLSQIIHTSEQSRNKKIQDIAKKYNMNNSGFFSKHIISNNLKTDLRKAGLTDIDVVSSRNNSYYLKENGKKLNPFQEYYDLADKPSQQEIVQSFIESNNNLKGIVDDKYVLKDGSVVKERVSDKQKKLFEKNKTKEQLEALRNSPRSVLAREVGTELHQLAEDTMITLVSNNVHANLKLGISSKENKNIPEKPDILSPDQNNEFGKSMLYLAKSISEQQQKIDPNGSAVIFTENFVLDPSKDRGGSQDLTIVYSDGSVGIYDYKFINFKMQKIDGSFVVPTNTEINFMKEKSYDLQLSEYKRILEEVYNVPKVRTTRILPFNVQYKNVNGKYTGNLSKLEGFNEDINYLMPIPVANELTDNDQVNDILEDLFKQKKALQLKVKSTFGTAFFERSKNELEKLRTSIKNLQVTGNLKPLFDSINITLNNEGSILQDVTVDNIGDLNRMQAEIELFESLYENIVAYVEKDELKEQLTLISSRLAKAKIAIRQKRTDLLLSINPELKDIQKEISTLASFFNYTSEIDHPVFETFNDIMKTVHGNKNRAIEELQGKLKPLHEGVASWAKSKGISTLNAFEKIIKNGKLISSYSTEFYKARSKAMQEGDTKHLKNIYKIKDSFKDEYAKDLAEQKKILAMSYEPTSKIYEIKLNNWINKNNLEESDAAWSNIYAILDYAEVKNPALYYSTEFKELQNNKSLLDYYNFYVETNRTLNRLVDERIDANFIANIRKSSLEMASANNGLMSTSKQFMEDFKDSFMLHQDDSYVSNEDVDYKIPLLYYNEIKRNENGKWVKDPAKKSNDLSNVLMLFAQAVYKKNELTKVEGVIDALKYHLMEQPVYKTNNLGNIVIDEYGKPETDANSKSNMELFNKHVLALVYGKKIQNKDTMIAGKYSMNKTISNIMQYFSVNALAFNYISAFGNVAAGTGNIFIKAAGGTFFNKKQVQKAIKLMASKGENAKYYKMAEYFNIESEHWAQKVANNLSASKLVKNLTLEKAYTLWQKGDNFMSNTILVSMAQNYGIDPDTQKVKRLSLLPGGTKSIYDMFSEKDDKIESGLTEAQFDNFRRKVTYVSRRLKGSNTTDEMSAAQMTVYGKAFMFFKNWLPPMAAERFQNVKYTKDLDEFEYGRYRSLFKDVLTNGWKKQLPRFLFNLVTFNAIKYKPGALDEHYEAFLKKNPTLKGKISKPEYVELRERTIREGLAEMRMIFAISLLLLAAKMDWDDDGVQNYKETALTKQLYKLTRRSYLELSFFSDPRSITELVRNPVPIITLGADAIKFISNTGDEFYDIITGLEGVERDETPIGHYSKRFVPVKHIERFLEDFQD